MASTSFANAQDMDCRSNLRPAIWIASRKLVPSLGSGQALSQVEETLAMTLGTERLQQPLTVERHGIYRVPRPGRVVEPRRAQSDTVAKRIRRSDQREARRGKVTPTF